MYASAWRPRLPYSRHVLDLCQSRLGRIQTRLPSTRDRTRMTMWVGSVPGNPRERRSCDSKRRRQVRPTTVPMTRHHVRMVASAIPDGRLPNQGVSKLGESRAPLRFERAGFKVPAVPGRRRGPPQGGSMADCFPDAVKTTGIGCVRRPATMMSSRCLRDLPNPRDPS